MRPHEKLDVYQISHRLAVEVHRLSLSLPRIEIYEQASQVRHSSKSIAAQIVEGHGLREYQKDYVRYLNRAYASGEETLEHIRLLIETGSAANNFDQWTRLLAEYESLCRKLFNYTAVVAQRSPSRKYPNPSSHSAEDP